MAWTVALGDMHLRARKSKSRGEGMVFVVRKNVSTVEVKLKGKEAKVMTLFEGILFAVDIFNLVAKLLDSVP